MSLYAYRDHCGDIDIDTIADTEDGVRLKYLQSSMGWRFEHPDLFDRDKVWHHALSCGVVVEVEVTEVAKE